jgi:hypothetical protein
MQKIMLLVVILCMTSFDQPRLVKTQVSDGITMLIPKDWRAMDELDFRERFPSVRAPLAAYTDVNRELAISINISATQWEIPDVAIAKDFFKSSIYNTFDRVEMIAEGIHEVNGKQFVFFEFESTVRGKQEVLGQQAAILNYSYIQYLVGVDRTLVFSFHCPRRMRQEWQDQAKKIMRSIKVAKQKVMDEKPAGTTPNTQRN